MKATSILGNLRTGVILLNHEFIVKYCNAAAEMIINRSAIKGKPAHEVLPSKELIAQLDNITCETDSISLREITILNKFAQPLTLNIDISIIDDHILLELDNADQHIKLIQQQVQHQQQDASRNLLRGMAHEIKNPLGGIRGAAQLLSSELDTSEIHEYTNIIINESDRLKNLIDRILRPQQKPELELLNIHEITEHVYSLINADGEKQVTISRDYDASIPELMVDRDQLIQVVLNIVKNAYEAVGNAGMISLITRISHHQYIGNQLHTTAITIAITDNGPGISDELYPNIFFPMISGRANGSGLGLPIAQKLISLNGGELKCSSHYNGCCFEIILPVSKK